MDEEESLWTRLQYRADRRNAAVTIALEKHPDTTDIMMIDSFYLGETSAIASLIQRYSALKEQRDACLGPAIWGRMRTNLSQVIRPQVRFYDAWSSPELRWCPYGWQPHRDILTSQENIG